jgi:hypothetical protein
MFQTVIDIWEVMRTDLYDTKAVQSQQKFSTNPYDYINREGFYF